MELIIRGVLFLIVVMLISSIKFNKEDKRNNKSNNVEAGKVRDVRDDPNFKFFDPSYLDVLFKQKEQVFGIYIIRNLTNGKVYVGQSKNAVNRSRNHLNKRGNVDIAIDLSNNHKFEVCLIPMLESEYSTLNSLEKAYIRRYNADTTGYNKTKGNR